MDDGDDQSGEPEDEDKEMADEEPNDTGAVDDEPASRDPGKPMSPSKRPRQGESATSPSSKLDTKRGRVANQPDPSQPGPSSSRQKASGPTSSSTRSSRSKARKGETGESDGLRSNSSGLKKLGH